MLAESGDSATHESSHPGGERVAGPKFTRRYARRDPSSADRHGNDTQAPATRSQRPSKLGGAELS
jgi:hypothetical protein